jgi:hypothetical protein
VPLHHLLMVAATLVARTSFYTPTDHHVDLQRSPSAVVRAEQVQVLFEKLLVKTSLPWRPSGGVELLLILLELLLFQPQQLACTFILNGGRLKLAVTLLMLGYGRLRGWGRAARRTCFMHD